MDPLSALSQLSVKESTSNIDRPTSTSNKRDLAPKKRPTTFEKSRVFQGVRSVATPESVALAASVGVDLSKTKYLGDFDEKMAADAVVPWDQNCSVWIPNIDNSVPIAELFDCIREGKVSNLNLRSAGEGYTRAAATITFMKRKAAEDFMAKARRGNLLLRGIPHKAQWSRNKVAPINGSALEQSRVVQLRGVSNIRLIHLFSSCATGL